MPSTRARRGLRPPAPRPRCALPTSAGCWPRCWPSGGQRALTQTDLTQETGLAAGTVSNIVRELALHGLVTTVPGSGRRGTTVRLGRGAGLAAGIDFGHRHLAVVLGEMSGEVLGETRERIDASLTHEVGLRRAAELLDGLLASHGAGRSDVRTIGMGLPAPITDDVVLSSAILPAWVGVNVSEAATRRSAEPCTSRTTRTSGRSPSIGAGSGAATTTWSS